MKKKEWNFHCRKIPCIKQLCRTMKLTTFLLFLTFFQVSAGVFSQNNGLFRLKIEEEPVSAVLKSIEEQTEFRFLYNSNNIDVERKVNIDCQSKSIDEVLKMLFEGTDVKYRTFNSNYVLYTDSENAGKPDQQQKQVSGKVTDSSKIPLPGVSVSVKGTTTGTVTDANGNYTLSNVPPDAVLIFSFVGMKSYEVQTSGATHIDIVMQEETIGLDEVVAIGYGTQKKATVTGSIATVKGEDLQKMPATNLSSTLAGRMAGVVVNTRGSAPGTEEIDINIRGKSTWQGGGPLIIIDGIANRSGFDKLNPIDIESISVLKDASAAIYGSRAADGVILVTTKRGKEGKPTINYTADFGLTQPTRIPDMARSWQYATYYTEAQRSGYIWTDDEIEKFKQGADPNLYPNYNLEDYMLQDFAPQTTHTISLRGGSNAVKYYLSGRYLYQDSFFKNGIDDFNSYNVRSNIDAQVSKKFSVSFDINARRDDVCRAVGSASVDNIDVGFFEEMLGTDPTKPIFYENGFPASIYDKNIVELIKGKAGENNKRTSSLNSQITAKLDLPFVTKGLFLEGTAAYDFSNVRNKQFSKTYDFYSYDNSTGEYSNLNTNPTMNRSLYDYYYNSYKYTLNGKLGYSQTFNAHHINSFIAYEQYSVNTEWISAERSTFLTDQIPYLFAGDANTQINDGSGYEFAYRNFFGRFSYSYNEKYLLDFTLRRDESVKFSKENRVGWFPGISVGWRLTEEPFIKGMMPYVDNLKLKASYGQMGSDNVDEYQYIATAALRSTSSSYVLGSDPSVVSTLYLTGTPNPDITWETADSYNIALEGSLWQQLLSFEVEYFLSKRSNILATRNASVPLYAGMSLPDENIGKAKNQGVEIMLSHRRKLGDFFYGVSGNFAVTANKIIYMDESANIPDYQRKEGHPIDSWLVYKTDGIFNTQDEFDETTVKLSGAQLGDIKYVNTNGDEVIDSNDKVRLYDSSLPKIIYGLNLEFAYKGFECTMLWQGQADAKTYINPATRNGDINIPMWIYNDRWTSENAENATMPRAFYHRSESYNTLDSDFWLKNASFLRLKSLELAYNLPKNIVNKASFTNAKVYISGLNLLLFDKIKDYDPEVVNDLGVFYPATKVYNIGVSVTF